MSDPIDPYELERFRRSIAMLRPDQPAGMKREEAIRVLEELQRLQRSDRRYAELVAQLRALLEKETRSRKPARQKWVRGARRPGAA